MIKDENDEMIARLEKDINTWENQEIEFIDDFPKNDFHELTKELAAFATSNPARIYLGVDKNKNVKGISTIKNFHDKDEIQDRLAGIIKSNIKPPIKVDLNFIDYNGNTILRIDVPKGKEPIYSSYDIPYIRNFTTSDRATPDQIKALHLEYFLRQGFLMNDKPYFKFYIKYWYREYPRYGIYVRNFGKETAVSYIYYINGERYEGDLPLIQKKELPIRGISDEEFKNGILIAQISCKDTNGKIYKQEDQYLRNNLFYDIYENDIER